ncbi:hypothetical protein [Candidatus Symbiopectobacterium sp. NZEC127]|uniref:hypothetical protein n=1 Tax=Candidatus Symbiopectobacterium sp. NZEC127 TaxID=2820472 RepID=UPI002227E763|nr:hypothetical protein [Candidatus Symbiopectobacterium sp. NZEC127]
MKRKKNSSLSKPREELQADAIRLFREFKDSLYLPNEHTIDCEGRKIQYTSICIKNESGLFEPRPPHALQPNSSYALIFYIGVMINSSEPGGDWIFIPIEMWYEQNTLIVISGIERAHVRLHEDKSEGRFYEATAIIKQSCLKALTDPRLE